MAARGANEEMVRSLVESIVEDQHGGDNEQDIEKKGSEEKSVIDQKAVWGLYCVYFIIGMINGFFATFFFTPTVCQYVFGPMGIGPEFHTTPAQCNVAPSVYQISWNFKLFFGIVLDLVPFMGSRRKGWMLFGWTGGLIMLGVAAVMVPHLIETHQFETYIYVMMVMCIFSTFADVAGDGMIIEISKHEPDSQKGYILTTCQMMRFVTMMVSTGLGTLFMSGKSYQPPEPEPGALKLPFELSYANMHWLLLFASLPFYIGMWIWLKDPPAPEHHETGCAGFRTAGTRIWTALKSFAIFMLLIQAVGIQAVASMINPANNEIASIAKPTNIQSGIGAFLGNLLFVGGVWVFRKFFLQKNWRFTLFMTQSMTAVCSALAIMIVYNTWGISRNGWFYMFQANVPNFIQGVGQVVSSLAVIEVSPPGLEATIYELLISAFNGALALAAVLQTQFGRFFSLEAINAKAFHDHPDKIPYYERKLATATIFCFLINIAGAAVFMWFLPKNPAQCRQWMEKKSWHTNGAATINLLVFGLPYLYANYQVIAEMTNPE